jgi:hypothetical protein
VAESRPATRPTAQPALADRRGRSTRELYYNDPWMHRWLYLTGRIMRLYRVRP